LNGRGGRARCSRGRARRAGLRTPSTSQTLRERCRSRAGHATTADRQSVGISRRRGLRCEHGDIRGRGRRGFARCDRSWGCDGRDGCSERGG
jgi:hypothetical protein